jgi:hypothetical protein
MKYVILFSLIALLNVAGTKGFAYNLGCDAKSNQDPQGTTLFTVDIDGGPGVTEVILNVPRGPIVFTTQLTSMATRYGSVQEGTLMNGTKAAGSLSLEDHLDHWILGWLSLGNGPDVKYFQLGCKASVPAPANPPKPPGSDPWSNCTHRRICAQ